MRHNPPFAELGRLQAGADNGVTAFCKYLDYKFPGSTFVLTNRELDDWVASLEWVLGQRPLIGSRGNDEVIMRRMLLYETVGFDRNKAIAGYERHHADVSRYFAHRPGDLLEMRIIEGEGWETLCPFLGVPIPDIDFPPMHRWAGSRESPQIRSPEFPTLGRA